MHFDPKLSADLAVRNARRDLKPCFEDGPVGDLERDALAEGLPNWLTQHRGWLYLAANASWPGLYKIGCTRRTVATRLREINNAGMASKWIAVQEWGVHDAHGLEALAHHACAEWHTAGELFNAPFDQLTQRVQQVVEQDLALLAKHLEQLGLNVGQ